MNFIYVLAPKALGQTTIPPCKLVYQGREYQSQPVEITVGATDGLHTEVVKGELAPDDALVVSASAPKP